jgi:hypothetical protein
MIQDPPASVKRLDIAPASTSRQEAAIKQEGRPMSNLRLLLCATAIAVTAASNGRGSADDTVIRFDLPSVVSAEPVQSATDGMQVAIELKLSSMIATPNVPRIDQWLVRCQPRDPSLSIADYSPRTEVASDIAGPIQIKKTNESSKSLGLAIDGAYGHLARLHSGVDQGTKDVSSYEMDRVAPVQAVTASGTINRARGVFFKLRWTAQQVLEGEKTFRITLCVPSTWRGGLIDVSVIAQSEEKVFAGLDSATKTLGAADFVVATYLQGDSEASHMAHRLFAAETELRIMARECSDPRAHHSLKSLLRHVAMKLDVESGPPAISWVDRLLLNRADPHMDKVIQKLPMPVRVAVLDYVDTRDAFLAINRRE